jgi:transposase
MSYKLGIDKHQLSLLPASLDDYVPENHICRVISAFTGQLNMVELGYKYSRCKDSGCRPYDPRMMLNLYIYGYLHRVRSSRRLEAETTRNIEVMWLMEGLMPDDRTICNFRKDNTNALKKTFREFVKMCHRLDLYGCEVVATDSTKFRANNSRKNIHNKTTVERKLSRLDKQINEYLNALEQGDKEAGESKPDATSIAAALKYLRQRKDKFEELKKRVADEGELSTVDPDARFMRSGGDVRPLDACYNVQTVVDNKYNLIVDFDIAERSDDKGNLYPMSEKTKDVLEVKTITNLADRGYYSGEDIAMCEANGITCLIAKPEPGGFKKEEGFTRKNFIYNQEQDYYECPCKNQLRYMREQKQNDGKMCRAYANYAACSKCPQRSKCTKGRHRQILRSPYQEALDVVDDRTLNNKALYRKRQEIVEHLFGTIKMVWGFNQFLCRTKPKITAETSLAYLAYNFRRVVNIFTENKINPAKVFR